MVNGYVVVFAVALQRYFVVHINWIMSFDYEKHISNSLNKNQIHLAYYCSFANARGPENEPDGNHKPNFELDIEETLVDGFDYGNNWEGLFHCTLFRYFRKFISN